MSSQAPPPRRTSLNLRRGPSTFKKSVHVEKGNSNGTHVKPISPSHSFVGGERMVKKLRLSKALAFPWLDTDDDSGGAGSGETGSEAVAEKGEV
uniref:Uncharacterized protein n=1 Tax=Nelumbo nucifera TaxID=4432 RepID=A0A822YT12_NELNU|nr:TPA_asm: hypothetical protein HUJ06_011219 [Nelumbo nucifera]